MNVRSEVQGDDRAASVMALVVETSMLMMEINTMREVKTYSRSECLIQGVPDEERKEGKGLKRTKCVEGFIWEGRGENGQEQAEQIF